MAIIHYLRNWYGRFERPLSSLSLILGFVFDAVTLKRVDTLWENIWILAHIFIVGLFISLIHIKERHVNDEKNPSKAHFWYVNILQFFFGGLLSTYLVFYFRSADILVTWPFILILAIAFWANESLKRHFVRLSFQIGLFFLSVYSFAIFLIPVITHEIGKKIFLLSGVCSLIFIFIYIFVLFKFTKDKFFKSKTIIFGLIMGITVVVNILYFTNLIPPIPLSLKDAGIYHSIQRDSSGNYVFQYEDLGFFGFFSLYPNFKQTPGGLIYAYSSVFSPSNLDTTIVHQWERYDDVSKKWILGSKVYLEVIGGRDGGFRTFSISSGLASGKWRVNVLTLEGQLIGRLRFNIINSPTSLSLKTDIKK